MAGRRMRRRYGDAVQVSATRSTDTSRTVLTAHAVLTGLCATLALLPILQRVLPALPISIAVGILFNFPCAAAITPLADFAGQSLVFL